MELLLLAVSFAVILVGAELFTNGVEWMGRRLDLAEGAVGSVLAAVGTALPETMIPLVAIVLGTAAGHPASSEAVGIGAVLGAPFMLATLAMFITGLAVVTQAGGRAQGDRMPVNAVVLGKDVRYFAVAYAIAVSAAFLPASLAWGKVAVAVLLLGLYGVYVRAHLSAERQEALDDDLAPLRFRRLDAPENRHRPRLRVIGVQVLAALGLIVGGAVVFVGAVDQIARAVAVDATIVALVIAPVATELPEKLNSVIWVRQGKDTLAMGNITGAMVFQSCIPTVVALVLAPAAWSASAASLPSFASAAVALVSTAAVFLPMRRTGRLHGRGLLVGGAFYVGYLAFVAVAVAGLA